MAKPKGYVKDDKVWRSMKANLRKATSQINVGWFEGQRYGAENNNLPMAQVAQWVEEGHRGGWAPTPPRPVIRTYFIPALAESGELVSKAIPLVHQVAMGSISWKKLHEKLAPSILYKFKYAIEVYNTKPNTPTTVRLKGFNNPWIETGALLNNARFDVAKYSSAAYRTSYKLK